MFAFQPVKRQREDDSDSDDERYLKVRVCSRRPASHQVINSCQKSRPWATPSFRHGSSNYHPSSNLPLRPSMPPSPPQALPDLETMTPAQSEHSETDSPTSLHGHFIDFGPPRTDMDMDADMNMDDDDEEDDFDIVGSQPPDSPFIQTFPPPMRPARLDPNLFRQDLPVSSTGRIATPIYASFGHRPSLSSGGMNGLGYPNNGAAGGAGLLGIPSNPLLQTPPVTRKQSVVEVDLDRTRRMPSPISEDEDIPDTPTALTQSQLSRLTVTTELMDVEPGDGDAGVGEPPGVVTTPTRGRKRSGALSGKGRFSMGYREDCEKCKQHVPGHYSHFLP